MLCNDKFKLTSNLKEIVMLNDVLPLLNSILKYNFFQFFERHVLFNINSL